MSNSIDETIGTFVRFECGSEDRMSATYGPFPWVQIAYDVVRVAINAEVDNGDIELAAQIDGICWKLCNGTKWTDIVIFHSYRVPGKKVQVPANLEMPDIVRDLTETP